MAGADIELDRRTLEEGMALAEARIKRQQAAAQRARPTAAPATGGRSAIEAEMRRRGLLK